MSELYLHGHPIKTVFDLLGDKENDITFSVGWALANCTAFCRLLLHEISNTADLANVETIHLQEFGQDRGYTDIEIVTGHLHVILEAKRGWNLPDKAQLKRYVPRLQSRAKGNTIVVLSECSQRYALDRLPAEINGIPVQHISWEQVAKMAEQSLSSSSHAEKRLLRELIDYLQGLITMQDQESNWVYVVSLGADKPEWCKLSWREIVTVQGQYFHPFGISGWPKIPPNYLGFRYDGKLQSIHHVDKYDVATDAESFADLVPGVDAKRWQKWQKSEGFEDAAMVVYTLGPAIVPGHDVVTGARWRANRVWAALDLLLTCKSISEARELTERRTQS